MNHFFVKLIMEVFVAGTVTTCIMYLFIRRRIRRFVQKSNEQNATEHTLTKARADSRGQAFDELSKELHDSINQKLSLAKFLVAREPRSPGSSLPEAEAVLQEVITDLRDLSRSIAENSFNLEEVLQTEIMFINRTGAVKATLHCSGEKRNIDAGSGIALQRIFREGIQNVIKHAGALEVEVSLHYEAQQLTLIVEDNGSAAGGAKAGGMGMTNMRTRAERLGGSFVAEHSEAGTRLTMQIPIAPEKQELITFETNTQN